MPDADDVPAEKPVQAQARGDAAESSKPCAPVIPRASDALDWSQTAFELELDAIARQIALNTVVQNYADGALTLAFLPELEVMLKPEIERQIKQAVERKLGVSLTLKFNSLPTLEVETPHQAELRKREEERQGVIQSIYQDPVVQQLKSVFGVELDEASVRKRQNEP